ncbi:ribosome assembly cofactor RimP [Cellulophaga baltica]|uniref:ribosome assembly cofactor RimP n=1 Tax=Cellulophaga TaxID=104264 RepID=UPI001C06D52E|nr:MULTISPECIES: ribosome assembly cofactor RimP [Cellulophaga]MBU2997210.1 ribosome assembly cofactor RimP [Cellulophaga baltica]MDO6768608.1 ribosome assembly cofactor RimP [Cellulophaga sp. 1_MG-2023]
MFKEKVLALLETTLAENPSIFLIDFKLAPGNKINITLDGDKGVSLNDCITFSRVIENNLDREEEDFSLEVASAGATSPMVMPRQYKKNIGRELEVRSQGVKFEGKLTEATDQGITLEWKAREPKPIGKGKITVQKKQVFVYSDIEEAKVIIKF